MGVKRVTPGSLLKPSCAQAGAVPAVRLTAGRRHRPTVYPGARPRRDPAHGPRAPDRGRPVRLPDCDGAKARESGSRGAMTPDSFFLAEWRTRQPGERRSITRARRLADALGLLGQARPVLSVVGSKGKGTAATYASACLAAAGLRVVTVTGPGYRRAEERIRVDGRAISASRPARTCRPAGRGQGHRWRRRWRRRAARPARPRGTSLRPACSPSRVCSTRRTWPLT